MIATITIVKDDGSIMVEEIRNALEPFTRKLDAPVQEMTGFGEYKFFGFTFQPHVMLCGKAGGF